jgi:diaminopimelate epimerase
MDFAKLQATGNDFVLIEAVGLEYDWGRLARAMCERRFGVGADGLILLLESKLADFRMRIFNADGSEAEVCGNGLRCFGRYVTDRGLAGGDNPLTIETTAGVKTVSPNVDGRFQVRMGVPRFRAEEIPLADSVDITPIVDYPVQVAEKQLRLTFVSMGNPHGVCFVEDVAAFPLGDLGPAIEHHSLFPQRLNFEIVEAVSRREMKVRVWERGAGETLSCGSGACAVAVAAQLQRRVDNQVDVLLPGGRLTVEWDGKGDVYLSGGAEMVFTGKWPEQNLTEE